MSDTLQRAVILIVFAVVFYKQFLHRQMSRIVWDPVRERAGNWLLSRGKVRLAMWVRFGKSKKVRPSGDGH